MSTRSNIYLKIKKETIGKLNFNQDKLPKNVKAILDYPIKEVNVPDNAEFLKIYHHFDGYPTGLGKTLLTQYKDYDTILNVLLLGDMSSMLGNTVRSFQGWRNEDTTPTIITFQDLENKNALQEKYPYLSAKKAVQEEYAYLFDPNTNEWLVADWNTFKWEKLEKVLERLEKEKQD